MDVTTNTRKKKLSPATTNRKIYQAITEEEVAEGREARRRDGVDPFLPLAPVSLDAPSASPAQEVAAS